MRKLILVTSLLLAVHIALLFTRRSAKAEGKETSPVRIGIVLDVGGRGDKSFNDGAYAGADSATKMLGSNIRFIEPGEGADREAGLRLLAAEGMNLVIGVGFIFTDDLANLAKEYPNTAFAGIDYALATDKDGNVIPPPPNVAALKFREEEGSYLVGALAALVSHTKKVGFVGGMDIPLIHKFEAGYRAGVKKVCPGLPGHRAVRGRHARRVQESGQGQGAGAQPVQPGRRGDLPRRRLDRAGRVRGRARDQQARHRRRLRSERRSAGTRSHFDGEGREHRDVRCDPEGAEPHLQGRHLLLRIEGRAASATSTTIAIARSFPTARVRASRSSSRR